MLSQMQQAVVDAWDRPVLVMAPVGTGKTLSLARRAARAAEAGLAPERMLCLSFTNRAAREVKGRVAAEIQCSTFHALCARILRSEAASLGLPGDFVIYDEEDATEVCGRLAQEAGLQPGGQWNRIRYAIWNALSEARLAKYDRNPPGKPREVFEECLRQSGIWGLHQAIPIAFAPLAANYVSALRDAHAVDFTDLVLGVATLWEEMPESLAYWQRRFAWIQVDEVQDTSRAEYRVLDQLAREHKQLSFFGDVDQTIYEWRGSAPGEILGQYKEHYQPMVVHYEENFRSTRRILEVCERVIVSHPQALTKRILPVSKHEGEAVGRHEFGSSREEYQWVARALPAQRERLGLRWSDMAVLTRTNFTARDVSEALEEAGVPHVRVEEEKFFQRAEIKAAVAYLRLLVNPSESASLFRFLATPPKGIGEATIARFTEVPKQWGLRLSDALRTETHQYGDPHGKLIEAWQAGRVVVLDTETTGLDLATDEVVEIAARRGEQEFYRIIRPSNNRQWTRLEEAARIHGVTRERIEAEGVPAEEALDEFGRFVEGCMVAGHNLANFDWPLLQRQSGGRLTHRGLADTLELSRRLLKLNRYRLGNVVAALGLPMRDAHRAMEDVKMTQDVLGKLVEMLEGHALDRRAALGEAGQRFEPWAERLEEWRRLSQGRPAAEVLALILQEGGLREHFARQENGEQRLRHLEELQRIAANLGDEGVGALLEVASLGLDLERQLAGEDKVRILTVHQAKGLEFEGVYVVKAVEGEFPSWRSLREGRLDEEHRLFYVAVSRARQFLHITHCRRDERGRGQTPSRYLAALHS